MIKKIKKIAPTSRFEIFHGSYPSNPTTASLSGPSRGRVRTCPNSTLRDTTHHSNTGGLRCRIKRDRLACLANCLPSSYDAAGTSRTACHRARMVRIRPTCPTYPHLAGVHDGARIIRVGSTSSVSALAGASADARVAISSRCVFGPPTSCVASIRAY